MLASIGRRPATLKSDGAWLVLAELNHRVMNELQVALSALRVAKRELGSSEPARFIDEVMLRLEGLGNVQRLLDRQREQNPLTQRVEALCRATALSKAAPLGIRLVLKLDDVTTDEETAWTICVVAYELMTKAFKQAFLGGVPGIVGVDLRQEGDEVVLMVTDNGVGADAGVRPKETSWRAPGFGAGILGLLAERLGGSLTGVIGPAGTTAIFSAPAPRPLQ